MTVPDFDLLEESMVLLLCRSAVSDGAGIHTLGGGQNFHLIGIEDPWMLAGVIDIRLPSEGKLGEGRIRLVDVSQGSEVTGRAVDAGIPEGMPPGILVRIPLALPLPRLADDLEPGVYRWELSLGSLASSVAFVAEYPRDWNHDDSETV